MRFFFVIFIIVYCSLNAFCSKKDSLYYALKIESNRQNLVDLYNKLAKEYKNSNPDSSLYFIKKALNLSPNIKSDALEEIDNAEAEIFKLSDKRFQKTYLTINKIAMQTMDLIARTMEFDNQLTGVPTGFKLLDDLLGGFQNSDFIEIGRAHV